MRFLFRADASSAMGTGHVMRCLALAEALHDRGHECHFLVAQGIASVDRRVAAEGAVLARIDAATGDDGAEATCRYAATIDARAIVVDGYHFAEPWRRALHRCGRPVLSFHDGVVEGAPHADIVLSPGLDELPEKTRALAPAALWLCGPAYILLRRELRRALAEPQPVGEQPSLLIGFGGSDPAGLTVPVVRCLADRPPPGLRLEVVIGGGVPGKDGVVETLSRLSAPLRIHVDPPDLGRLMRQAGLAVSAAGGTIGELAAFGVPSLIVVVADNQLVGARQASSKGWCRMLDARVGLSAAVIAEAARRLWEAAEERAAMALRASSAVDGQGVARVSDALIAAAEREH
jgi:UDP-2,4-diacetamido-2,4,6-trideoxy-beta-L-altropyranose hydrolase